MVGLLVGAAVLGIIIVAMEKGEFPGWGKMIVCVLAAFVPTFVINLFLPPSLFFIGLIVGTVCTAFAIAVTCDMSPVRASIAAGVYLAFEVVVHLIILFAFR